MPAGFRSRKPDGKLQFDSNLPLMYLRRTGSVATIAYSGAESLIRVPVPGSWLITIVAFQTSGYVVGYQGRDRGNNYSLFTSNAPAGTAMNYYVFDLSTNIPPSNSGFQTRTLANEVIFSSRYRVMDMLDAGPGIWSGRSVAVGLPTGGGVNQHTDINPDSGGYTYHHYFAVYGGSAGGDTVSAGAVVIQDGYVFSPNYPDGAPDYDRPAPILAIDVTGVPIGQTFF